MAKLSIMLCGGGKFLCHSDEFLDYLYRFKRPIVIFVQRCDQQEYLYSRDASYLDKENGEGKHEANGQRVFWSRGNGWVAGGLARLLKELPKNYPKRDFYLAQYKEILDRVAGLQQADGLWRSSLLDPAGYPGGESSGSGFYIYAMAWGINNKVLDRDKYLPVVKKACTGLNTLVHPDGMVDWTQPIGADPRRNFSSDSWEVYGAGAICLPRPRL